MDEGTVFFSGGAAEIASGVRLNDTYSILEFVGEGGVSQVYRGFNIHTGQRVAIKFLRPEVTNDPDTKELFRREATVLSELHHEAIVRYLGYSFDPAIKREYLVMEFVEGVSLKRRLATGALTQAQTLTLKTRLASGLAAAHVMGVVHRDISPDNVVLPGGEIERAKIIDFGIARASMFGEGTVIGDGFAGKMAYISPEQVRGEPVTPASDIYSLGLVLAESASGAALDMGRSLAELAPRRAKTPDLATVYPALRPLIARMLRPEASERFPDMDAVAAWAPEPERAPPPPRPSWLGFAAAAIGALILVASLAGVAYVFLGDASKAPLQGSEVAAKSDGSASPPQSEAAEATPAPTVPSVKASGEAEAPAAVFSPRPIIPAPSSTLSDAVTQPTPSVPASSKTVAPSAPAVVAKPRPQPLATAPAPPTASPSTQVATLATPPSTAPKPTLAEFVRGFDGGSCWLVREALGDAPVEAIGAQPQDFDRFAADWSRRLGSAPRFERFRIEPAQCPALDLLRHIDATHAPQLRLQSRAVGGQAPLAGVVSGLGGRALVLLVVNDDGRVLSLRYTSHGADEAAFTLGLERVDDSDVGHALAVLAWVGDAPSAALAGLGAEQTRPVASVGRLADLVPKLIAEGADSGVALAVATLVKQ